MFDKKWTVKNYIQQDDAERAIVLAQEMNLPLFLAETLVKRGIYTAQAAKGYFTPSVRDLCDPYLFEDMEAAVQRILDASEAGEHVTVYGDYDCDGISATAILWHFLKHKMELNVDFFIPNRFEDGYGLSQKAVGLLAQRGTTLMITVDCGIVSIEEVALARELGMDVIITDHHRCLDRLPEAEAIIDPVRPGCSYPFSGLCGAGVAYKLIEALAEAIGLEARPLEYISMAAVATIGDSVPLTGENRILVSAGLQQLSRSCWPGLHSLLKEAGLQSPLSVRGIAFGVVPRINAAGRLGSGERALRLLLSEDRETADLLAQELSAENRNRQVLEGQITAEAILPESIKTVPGDAVVVSVGRSWHHGVIGIVASRLTERFNKPSFVFAYEEDGETIRGSARSVPGFNIHQALCSCGSCLEKFGGHEMAAGMSLKANVLPKLIEGLNRYAAEAHIPGYLIPEIQADCEISISDIGLDNAALLTGIQPCGEGNPEPVYLARGLKVVKCSAVGSSEAHLRIQFSLEDGSTGEYGRPVTGIAFGCGKLLPMVSAMTKCDALFKMTVNEWNGRKSVSLQLLDIREADVYNTNWGRKDLVLLYNVIRGFYKEGFTWEDLPVMRERLSGTGGAYTWFKLFKGIEVFGELGLLQKNREGHQMLPTETEKKIELESSAVYRACMAYIQKEV